MSALVGDAALAAEITAKNDLTRELALLGTNATFFYKDLEDWASAGFNTTPSDRIDTNTATKIKDIY
jgi:hypothetical protein